MKEHTQERPQQGKRRRINSPAVFVHYGSAAIGRLPGSRLLHVFATTAGNVAACHTPLAPRMARRQPEFIDLPLSRWRGEKPEFCADCTRCCRKEIVKARRRAKGLNEDGTVPLQKKNIVRCNDGSPTTPEDLRDAVLPASS